MKLHSSWIFTQNWNHTNIFSQKLEEEQEQIE